MSQDVDRIFSTLTRIEDKIDRHTDVISELKANQHKPDECPASNRIKADFEVHLKRHETQRLEAIAAQRESAYKTLAKECARLIASAITAIGAVLSMK